MEGIYLHNLLFLTFISDKVDTMLYALFGWGNFLKSTIYFIFCTNYFRRTSNIIYYTLDISESILRRRALLDQIRK